jgi:hypothetical protein
MVVGQWRPFPCFALPVTEGIVRQESEIGPSCRIQLTLLSPMLSPFHLHDFQPGNWIAGQVRENEGRNGEMAVRPSPHGQFWSKES